VAAIAPKPDTQARGVTVWHTCVFDAKGYGKLVSNFQRSESGVRFGTAEAGSVMLCVYDGELNGGGRSIAEHGIIGGPGTLKAVAEALAQFVDELPGRLGQGAAK